MVAAVRPDSGSVVPSPPGDVEVLLSEVVSERIAAPRPDIGGAVLLSPVLGRVAVTWHRNRLSVRPREGFRPGRIYRLEIFPVLVDLRQNRMREGRTVVFSTGPAEIPSAVLSGAVVDWAGGRPGTGALVEAVLMPDSLPYRTLADSSGSFALRQIPPGEYLVYGIIDQDGNRERGPREAFDTARVTLADSALSELFAFPHDTTGPRLRTVELVDSLTLRLTFDRPLDPSQALDTAAVRLAAAADSTTLLPVRAVLTPQESDSLRAERTRAARPDSARAAARDTAGARRPAADTALARPTGRDTSRVRAAAADSATVRRPAADTARAGARPPAPRAADSARARRPAGDSARARAQVVPTAAPPPLAGPEPGPAGQRQPAAAVRDSTPAQKMLARRPAPTAVRMVLLESPLAIGARYLVFVAGVRGLSGVAGDARGQILVPRPRPQPARGRPAADSARAAADSAATRPPSATPDSTRPAAPPPIAPGDSVRTPPPQPQRPPPARPDGYRP